MKVDFRCLVVLSRTSVAFFYLVLFNDWLVTHTFSRTIYSHACHPCASAGLVERHFHCPSNHRLHGSVQHYADVANDCEINEPTMRLHPPWSPRVIPVNVCHRQPETLVLLYRLGARRRREKSQAHKFDYREQGVDGVYILGSLRNKAHHVAVRVMHSIFEDLQPHQLDGSVQR